MLTESERIKADIVKAKTELAKVDKDIVKAGKDIEERQVVLASLEDYRARKINWLALLEGQLERAEARLEKPQPTGETVKNPSDGIIWQV